MEILGIKSSEIIGEIQGLNPFLLLEILPFLRKLREKFISFSKICFLGLYERNCQISVGNKGDFSPISKPLCKETISFIGSPRDLQLKNT